MKLNFYLRFSTQFGQQLLIETTLSQPGTPRSVRSHAMQYLNQEFWQASLDLELTTDSVLQYKYILVQNDGTPITEGEQDRHVQTGKTSYDEIQLVDTWNAEGWYENVFYTTPFQETLLAENKSRAREKAVKSYTHIFRVKAPLLKKNEGVFITGNSLAMGNWQKDQVVPLSKDGNWWTIKLTIPREDFPLTYKYGLYDAGKKAAVQLEGFNDRLLYGQPAGNPLTVVHDGFARFPFEPWKGAGVAVPVFSLKSRTSFGVGEFTDIKLLADWAKEAGLKLIQVLPVNDTTATRTNADSYPYAAISAFALHPIYINLEKVAGKGQSALVKQFRKKQKDLNDLPKLDYEQVLKFKFNALQEIFNGQKESFAEGADYQAFFEDNKHWLVPYAAFSHLRDKNGTSDFNQWKTNAVYNKAVIEKYTAPRNKQYEEIALYYFIQYHLHLQLREATEYAHKKGIIVKGDIAIGVFRYGCDAWQAPELYNMDMQAGAPPDDFAIKGQNWGFPTYNWEKMQENNFLWWRQRFEQMSNYFDAFRIDHILGFFRIWSIPLHAVEGIMGYFVPAIPVHQGEFAERGIPFDQDRFTRPYITDAVLAKLFDADGIALVKERFLGEEEKGAFALKEAFDTQRKVEAFFTTPEASGLGQKIQTGLYDLLSNVILFEEKGSDGTRFHFRINTDHTLSFQALDPHTQYQLKELYNDYFYRRQDLFWKQEALKKLPALKASTSMMVCGEDLGMVPHCVPAVMDDLGILSLEIQRMPKDPNTAFANLKKAPYLSVVTPSTHDMSTVRGWWQEDPAITQRFFNHELGQWGEAPATCTEWISKAILLQHLHSPAMWSIFQLQDLFGMETGLRVPDPAEERINIPADSRHYWGYRMHITLEDLIREKKLSRELKVHIETSKR